MTDTIGVQPRLDQLDHTDPQFHAAQPRADVITAARAPGLRLTQVLEKLIRGYADRPALGTRSVAVQQNPATGRVERVLQSSFETVTYGRLWSDVEKLAAAWAGGPDPVTSGDFVVAIGFASTEYLTIDLTCAYLGLVSIPLQHNSSASRLNSILTEASPRVVTVAADYLDLAVESIRGVPAVGRLVVFDLDLRTDDHRAAYQRARAALAGTGVQFETLADLLDTARTLTAPPPFTAGSDDRLAMILYTSGSTGAPKGAMWTERMLTTLWTTDFFRGDDIPVIEATFMPLNHLGGRIPLSAAFQTGGTNYFVPESDLSSLFDDYALVRPTHLTLVPRVVDMLFQLYQTRAARLIADGGEPGDADHEAQAEIREKLLGGRVLGGFISTAPLSADMRLFLESTLQVHLVDGYGLTEIGGVTSDGVILRPPVIDYKLVDVPELGYFVTDVPHPRGELLVRTRTATPGYYKRPEVTAEVFDADGYYRTGDVMSEISPDHLVYVDRRNNVIKLAQGEFVAVANLEAEYANAPLIRQIFVYGNSERSTLLAVVVPTQQALDSHRDDAIALKDALWKSIRHTAAAAELQSYEIPADLLIEDQPFTAANGLLSGVGKLLRPKLKERYGPRLEQLYLDLDGERADKLRTLQRAAAGQPVLDTVIQAAQALLGLPGSAPEPDSHFTDLGGDSLSALSFSNLLGEVFGVEVPVGAILSASSDLAGLSAYVAESLSRTVRRPTASAVHGPGADRIKASDLSLDRFIDEQTLRAAADLPAPVADPKTVLITGANGYLGRFLTLQWLRKLHVTGGRVIALVRGAGRDAAFRRLADSYAAGDPLLADEFRSLSSHLEVLPADIAEDHLGADPEVWHQLARDVDLIVHSAALVNHRLPYDQLFGPNVNGTAEVIRLAISERLKPVTYVSTVAVAMGVDRFLEDGDIRAVSPTRRIDDSYANGYGNSKWAGEVLLREAHDLCGLPVSVFRSDMILAHTAFAGELNVPDQFTRLLISLLLTGIAPGSFYTDTDTRPSARAHYPGLPVDFVAAAITAIGGVGVDGYRSYDVMNPHDDGVSLDTFVDWLIADGAAITRIDDYTEWLQRFDRAMHGLPEKKRQTSLLNLIDAYRAPQPSVPGALAPTAVFSEAVRSAGVTADGEIPHLDRELIRKYVRVLDELGLV